VSASDFPQGPFKQIDKSTIHPVLPENANASAEWRNIWFDHTESSMNRPKDKEDDEQVVCVPESFKVCSARLLDGCEEHGHEGEEHDISRPSGTCGKVCEQPSLEP